MVKKHILPLTYEPKIMDVRTGKCTQTIRPITSSITKDVGDLVMFHGWAGKPYRSEWNWRTPYCKIIEAFDVKISDNGLFIYTFAQTECYPLVKGVEADKIAKLDGFDNYDSMYQQFKKMYGNKLKNITFRVIRWSPVPLKMKLDGIQGVL